MASSAAADMDDSGGGFIELSSSSSLHSDPDAGVAEAAQLHAYFADMDAPFINFAEVLKVYYHVAIVVVSVFPNSLVLLALEH
jgi:hypothetical protein